MEQKRSHRARRFPRPINNARSGQGTATDSCIAAGGRALLALLLVLFCGSAAMAEKPYYWYDYNGTYKGWPTEFDGRYPATMPPGDGWKMISYDGRRSPTTCIGDYSSPECIVDTVIACEYWSPVGEGEAAAEFDPPSRYHPVCEDLEASQPNREGVGFFDFNVQQQPRPPVAVYFRSTRLPLTRDIGMSHMVFDPDSTCNRGGYCIGDLVLVLSTVTCRAARPAGPEDKDGPHDPRQVVAIPGDDTRLNHCFANDQIKAVTVQDYPEHPGRWRLVQTFFEARTTHRYYRGDTLDRAFQSIR